MNLWKRFRRRFLTDRADSILVPAMILAPVMALTLGMAVEVVKNGYIKAERVNAIQDSASSAVTLTNTRGSLDWKVVDRIVNEYEHNRYGKRVFSSTANSKLKYDDFDEDGKAINRDKDGKVIRESAESTIFDDTSKTSQGCFIGHGDDEGQRYPQYKVTLNTARGEKANAAVEKTVSFTRTQPTEAKLNQMANLRVIDPATGKPAIYRSVTVQIIDQTPNMIMSMMGAPCQKFDLTASAVTFSASSDLQ